MGAEANCTVTFKGKSADGKARLETDVMQFRGGEMKLSIPFKEIQRIASRNGVLSVTFRGATAKFELGAAASKWADKIQNPPSRISKIGIKPGARVCALGVEDETFLSELEEIAGELSIGRVMKNCDAVFFGADRERSSRVFPD